MADEITPENFQGLACVRRVLKTQVKSSAVRNMLQVAVGMISVDAELHPLKVRGSACGAEGGLSGEWLLWGCGVIWLLLV